MRFISMVIAKEISFSYVINAVTVCRIDPKQSLTIRKYHSSVSDNKMKEAVGLDTLSMNWPEEIIRNQKILERIVSVRNIPFQSESIM